MKKLLGLVLIISFISLSVNAQISNAQAMFLYNFSRLIKWPDNTAQGDFVFGVVGNIEVYNNLIQITNGKKVGMQNITVKYFKEAKEITNCHVIFISNNKISQFNEIMSKAQNKAVLIVTEKKGMINSGSVIDFVISDDKLRYIVSEENARKNNLILSKNIQDMAMAN